MTNRKRNSSRGFSLIELLIVVAIMLVIAAIAVPSLLAAKKSANETATSSTMHTVVTALENYSQTFGTVGYPALAKTLGGTTCGGLTPTSSITGACMIDDKIAAQLDAGTLGSYNFVYTNGANVPSNTFTLSAVPANAQAGSKGFYIDQNHTIHYTTDGSVPTSASPVLGQ
jgi:prepilin-type N-terminal cleavage/methylation domain-containing protein